MITLICLSHRKSKLGSRLQLGQREFEIKKPKKPTKKKPNKPQVMEHVFGEVRRSADANVAVTNGEVRVSEEEGFQAV